MNTKVVLISSVIACALIGAPAALATSNYYKSFNLSIKTKAECLKKGGKWLTYQPNRTGTRVMACKF